jgi:ABC-2 type transport system ATP-binding protein
VSLAQARPGSTHALSVEAVSKSYGPLKALDEVTLEVERGEFVGLLGPNGAGKSTLFQILSGLFVADAGRVTVLGHDLRRSATAALAGIGVVFQQPTLDLDLSVRANLRFSAQLHGLRGSRRRERIDAELERLGLSERAADLARTLSGGNRRRVELARALLHEPSVLLMDEATVGLDPASRRQLLDYVLDLRRDRSVGVLWATHLVDEVERADRIVVLHRGRVLEQGSPAEVASRSGASDVSEAFLAMTAVREPPVGPDSRQRADKKGG